MGDGVEGLGEVQGHDGCAGWGFPLVETAGDGLSDREECGCSGP